MKKLLVKLVPKLSLQILFFRTFRKFYSLKRPMDFYEKLIWLNFNDFDSKKTRCADKYQVRQYLKELGLQNYLNELYGVYDDVTEIDFDSLPEQFILKCNHGANFNIICFNKSTFNIKSAQKKLKNWLREDFSLNYAELHYKNIPRKIICEEFLGDKIWDYKIYCFSGEPKYIMICTNPSQGPVSYYLYDFNWTYIDFLKEPVPYPSISKPGYLTELYDFCQKLSSPFKFVRVDTYIHNNRIIFGEMTFTPSGFLDNDTKGSINKTFGNHIQL